ncbi:hypothetical protein AA637_03505 [Cyanobacterium sp. HL-69]|uniref:hypothetical protein n=1 Tax=unclassified Cyanobacterium TaxID=2629879 RepID=UPI0008526828|nr:hypothetical protein [Cyanobacterium sp. IPPAS B-1200]AUC60281.1 hypothetical protein AA637_03505 [Cyanobacterium sp. HL-69]OEJ79251.1 hypothetical protein A5482_10260 [Cyanobacterium sp. IPPAS B-1200]
MVISFLINCLRLFGIIWILGGIVTIKESFNNKFFNSAIAQITLKKEDQSDTIFIFLCGIETLVSGIGLFLAQKWVIFPLLLLIFSQISFFIIRFYQSLKVESPEEKENFTIQSTTKNAFIVSVAVTIIAFLLLFE